MSDSTNTNEGLMSNKSADDQITDLLAGAGETGDLEDLADEETLNAKNQEEEAPQEEELEEGQEPETEETTQEAAEEGKESETWGQVLGLEDSQVVLDDNGNFEGVITKVGGETQQVDLKELVKGYQIDKYNSQRSQVVAEERKQFEQFAQQQATALQERVTQADSLVNTLEQQLVGEYDSINWEALRQADPAEYAARRQDFAVRYQQVQKVSEGIKTESDKLQQEQAMKRQQAQQQLLYSESQQALAVKPEWSDPKIRIKAMEDMSSFIQDKYGYSAQEVAGITDHRVIGLIEDAMAYQAIKKGSAPKLKKPVPKFQKPGSNRPAPNRKAKLDKLYNKAAKSQSRELKDDAITQLLLNS